MTDYQWASCGEFTGGATLPEALFLAHESVFVSVTTAVPKVHAFLRLLAVGPPGHVRSTHSARVSLKETSCCWKQTALSTHSHSTEKRHENILMWGGHVHTYKTLQREKRPGRSAFSTFLWCASRIRSWSTSVSILHASSRSDHPASWSFCY